MNYSKTKYSKMDDPMRAALRMGSDGYRQVSRKFRIVARVDMPTKEMKQYFIDENFGDENSGVPSGTLESQEEQYRRVHSRDTIENVPEDIMRELR